VTVARVDYSSQSSISSALHGHSILIITLSPRAPPDLHPRIVQAAADAGVEYVVPNYYGFGLSERMGSISVPTDSVLGGFEKYVDDVRSVEGRGVKWVALCCGFWYEFSLGMGESWLGFDIEGRKVSGLWGEL
jgi:hypothetical protein